MHISLQMCGGVHVCTCVNLYVRVGTYMHHVSVVVCMCLCVQKCTYMHVCVLKHVRKEKGGQKVDRMYRHGHAREI